MNTLLTPGDAKDLYKSIVKTDAPWAVYGILIESYHHFGMWRSEADNFTQWVRDFAEIAGKKEASLWRYKASVVYFLSSAAKLAKYQIEISDFYDLSKKASPENLELLLKLERVVPEHELEDLYQKVYTGSIRRVDLRDKWIIYRALIGEKTAKGRNVKNKRYFTKDAKSSIKLSNDLNLLRDEFHNLINVSKQNIHRFYIDYEIDGKDLQSSSIVKFDKEEIHVHAFYKVEGIVTDARKHSFEFYQSYADFFWIVCDDVHYRFDEVFTDYYYDESWGVITVSDAGEIAVAKEAGRQDIQDKKRIKLLEKVLLNSV
jgi:hypothetical protein